MWQIHQATKLLSIDTRTLVVTRYVARIPAGRAQLGEPPYTEHDLIDFDVFRRTGVLPLSVEWEPPGGAAA